jgi:hypothetical protein
MRFAFLLPAALLAMGCGVPSVSFADAGSSRDATRDSPQGDGPNEAQSGDAEADAENEASAEGGGSDAGDAGTDAPDYCRDDAGAPGGFKCCMGVTGVVCGSNMCNNTTCMQCATINCSWPNVCCSSGNTATCKPAGSC